MDSSSPREFLVATVSGFGVIVEATYVILFLIFAPSPMKAKTATLVGILNVGFVGVTIGVTLLALEGDARVDAIGYICAALSVLTYGSPLAALVSIE
ncbi:hypothetical protein RJ641_021078 [Dillenia turbinata]|uniref:Uncharacterized protein n=1 Tax=Dillenia turbinata TaxID=194707 RepID=A0AAN8YV09_9MAGN